MSEEEIQREADEVPADVAKKLQNIFGFMAMPDTKILQDTEVIVDRKTGKKVKVKYGVEVLNTPLGISYETYQKYKNWIDSEVQKALLEREKRKKEKNTVFVTECYSCGVWTVVGVLCGKLADVKRQAEQEILAAKRRGTWEKDADCDMITEHFRVVVRGIGYDGC